MILSKERKGELSYLFLKEILRKKEIHLDSETFNREVGNIAKKFNISKEEYIELAKTIILELVDEMFQAKKFKISKKS